MATGNVVVTHKRILYGSFFIIASSESLSVRFRSIGPLPLNCPAEWSSGALDKHGYLIHNLPACSIYLMLEKLVAQMRSFHYMLVILAQALQAMMLHGL